MTTDLIQTAIDKLDKAGSWLSAALSDPNVCQECKTDFENALEAIEQLRAHQSDNGWQPIGNAPRDRTFLCRKKNSPHITFEAFIDKERESWEMPEEYEVLCNETYPDDILDDAWEAYEWKQLPHAATLKAAGGD